MTVSPLFAITERPPSGVARTVPPAAVRPNFGCCTAGSEAACADLTTSTSDMPSACAVTFQSTPGRTSEYVAVSPESVGAGRGSGHDHVNVTPRLLTEASVPVPPPENRIVDTVAAGPTVPSALAMSVVSTGTQPLLR